MTSDEHLRFPIGKLIYEDFGAQALVPDWMDEVRTFPENLQKLVQGAGPEQLERTYRPGGWTGRQVIHHLYDSHTHAFMRFKWALTESKPAVLPYNEVQFAVLADYSLPVEVALAGLIPLHLKWVSIMESMAESDWDKVYFHLGAQKEFTLRYALAMYAWHGRHHMGHIRLCLNP